MTAATLTALAAQAGDTLSYETAELILEHRNAAAALANFYTFRRLEILHQAGS